MPVTYKKIATVTVSTATTANMEFTNIPATYDDLVLHVSGRASATNEDWWSVVLNGSTANFSGRFLFGTSTAAQSFTRTDGTQLAIINRGNTTASTFSSTQFYFPNYKGSTNKSFSIDSVGEGNAGESIYMLMQAALWSNTAAINAIRILPASGSVSQYSSASLYGISKS